MYYFEGSDRPSSTFLKSLSNIIKYTPLLVLLCLFCFISIISDFKRIHQVAEAEVGSVTELYSLAGRNADALALYFGEDPARCPFEQVAETLLNFLRLFRKANEENSKQAELEKKKVQKEAEMEKAKGISLSMKAVE